MTSRILLIVLLGALCACGGTTTTQSSGGSGSPPACGEPQCGGDIVGTWLVTQSCLSVSATATMSGCSEPLTVSGSDYVISGTLELRGDGTFTQTTNSLSVSMQEKFPAACLKFGSVTMTCAQLDQAMQQQASVTDGGLPSLRCVDAGDGGCMCSGTMTSQNGSVTGTYTVSQGILTRVSGTATYQSDYCVRGTNLSEIPRTWVVSPSVTRSAYSGAIVYQKQ
jgi:hypothetical protein